MRTLFGILFIFSIHYAAELKIQVKPDTIYVGALTTLTISVKDLQKGDVPIFPTIAQQPDICPSPWGAKTPFLAPLPACETGRVF